MNKLLKLKEWLTVADAAGYLSILLKEEVSEADVLRLALDGRLQLSVFFPNPTWALRGNFIEVDSVGEHLPRDHYTWVEEGDANYDYDFNVAARRRNLYNELTSERDTLIADVDRKQVLSIRSEAEIEGVWDLTMRGRERLYVHRLSGGKPDDKSVGGVAVVKKPNEQGDLAHAIVPDPPSVRLFPNDSHLVVRTVALQELERGLSGLEKPETKPLVPKERHNLLVMIAALAEMAKLDIGKPSKAAAAIEQQILSSGAGGPLKRAIEDHLKRSREVYGNRAEDQTQD